MSVLAPLKRADQHPVAVYLARLAPGSRRTLRQALDVIARLLTADRCDALALEWSAVRYQHTAAARAELAARYAPATANKALAALRGVLQEAWRLGLLSAEDYRRAADLPVVRGQALPKGRALGGDERRALFAVCAGDRTPAGRRDAALLALLYGAGLRRAEAAALDLADVDAESGAVTIRAGKGRKGRVGYVGDPAPLGAWSLARGELPGPFLCPIRRGGRVQLRRLSPQALYAILRRRGDEASVAAFSPHDLRRSFVSDLLDAGADLATVQKLAGHSNPTTTARYDRRGEAAKRKAAGLLRLAG